MSTEGNFFSKLFPKKVPIPVQQSEWNYTAAAKDFLKADPFYEERGPVNEEKFYKNRPMIARDTPINGGVYVNLGHKVEAVVVDDTKDDQIADVYQTLKQRLAEHQYHGRNIKGLLLTEAYNLVQEVMPYNASRSDLILDKTGGEKIYLSWFLTGGVCRHQALLLGYLLEKLTKEGYSGGKVSIDRNFVKGHGGHAWVRYTNSKGAVYIVDTAQHYVGSLAAMDESKNRWFYERPEDVEQANANKFGKLLGKIRNIFAGS